MEEIEFKRILRENAAKIGEMLNDKQLDQLYQYKMLILEWNEKINLTAITDDLEFIIKHFVDSFTISKYIDANQRVIDIGTGAGFPGIPIQLLDKGNSITLMDSLNKRIKVLEDITQKIKLKKTTFIHGRAEEIFQNKLYREQYDVAVSRAVANLNVLVELMLPAVKVGGICVCMKGINVEQELDTSKKAITELGGRIRRIETITLPELNIDRNIIIIEKQKETPKKYPRKPGTPQKQPI